MEGLTDSARSEKKTNGVQRLSIIYAGPRGSIGLGVRVIDENLFSLATFTRKHRSVERRQLQRNVDFVNSFVLSFTDTTGTLGEHRYSLFSYNFNVANKRNA